MSNFTKCNNKTGYYTTIYNIENFKFRIKLKEIKETIPIIRYEIPLENASEQLTSENVGYYEERIFDWQEKGHNFKETKTLDEDDNVKDKESDFNEKKIKQEIKYKIISYTNDDNYKYDGTLTNDNKTKLEIQKDNCEYKGSAGELNLLSRKNIFKSSLSRSNSDDSQTMYIIVDMNDYERDPTSLLKREHVLFILCWFPQNKSLTVSPDFNNIEDNPYILEINYDSKQIFHFSIEQISEKIDALNLTNVQALAKISLLQNDIRMRKMFKKFDSPNKDVTVCVIILEILSAHHFKHNNLYVEYTVELPYRCQCYDRLKGVTQISKKGQDESINFGHLFELSFSCVENNKEDETFATPQIFFEVISCDYWGRKSTEGFCCIKIPTTRLGYKRVDLNCTNVGNENNSTEMEKFFIGKRHNLKDVTSIGTPSTFRGDCLVKSGTTTSTGILKVARTVVSQSRRFTTSGADGRDTRSREKHVSLKNVNAVLHAYKVAKQKFKACLESKK